MKEIPAKSQPQSYLVGYRRPPKKNQFRKGQSGNPAGINRKTPRSIVLDLRQLLEQTLNHNVTLDRGETEQIMTMAAAGIQALVEQFAKGDHRARRDLIVLAEKLGVDLTAGQSKAGIGNAIARAVSAEDEALLAEYVQHQIEARDSVDDVPRLPEPDSSCEPDQINADDRSSYNDDV